METATEFSLVHIPFFFSVCCASGTRVCVGTLKRISWTPANFDSILQECTKELLSRYPGSMTSSALVFAFCFSHLRKFSCFGNVLPCIAKTVHNSILSNSTTSQRIGSSPEIWIKNQEALQGHII